MTEKTRQRALAVIVGISALVIIWLLMQHKPVYTAGSTTQLPDQSGNTIPSSSALNIPPFDIQGSTYNIGGLTPQQLALSLVYGGGSYPQATSSCDCGCDENSPINTALQGVATFINQYTAEMTALANNVYQQAWSGLPDWMTQYINSGGLSV